MDHVDQFLAMLEALILDAAEEGNATQIQTTYTPPGEQFAKVLRVMIVPEEVDSTVKRRKVGIGRQDAFLAKLIDAFLGCFGSWPQRRISTVALGPTSLRARSSAVAMSASAAGAEVVELVLGVEVADRRLLGGAFVEHDCVERAPAIGVGRNVRSREPDQPDEVISRLGVATGQPDDLVRLGCRYGLDGRIACCR
jgi:hypothetical protein